MKIQVGLIAAILAAWNRGWHEMARFGTFFQRYYAVGHHRAPHECPETSRIVPLEKDTTPCPVLSPEQMPQRGTQQAVCQQVSQNEPN
jgi:hypothetical protein